MKEETDAADTPEHRLATLEHAVAVLSGALGALSAEVVTRRVVVLDADGTQRVVAEVVDGTAEVRVQVARTTAAGEVVLFAGPARLPAAAPALGLQLRAGGDLVAEMGASADGDDRWQPTGHGTRDAPGDAG